MQRRYQLCLFVICLTFVSATAAFGQHAWTWANKPIGLRSDSDWINTTVGVAIDNNDNRIIVGNFYDSATFGGTKLISYNTVDMYIAKLNSSGVFQWAKQIGGWDVSEYALDVDVDPSGSAYMAGYFSDSLNFDGIKVKDSASTLVAVAKYNSSGTIQWARRAAGFQTGLWGGVAYSPTGHLYVGAGFSLTKYNATNGDSVWTWQLPLTGGSTSFQIDDIAVDKTGDYIYITGMFGLNAQIGTTHLTTPVITDRDIFVAKFDKNGNAIWAKRAGGTSTTQDQGFGVEVDGSGNVYLTGSYSDYAYFDTDTIYSNFSGHAFFVAKYDVNGNVVWVKGASSTTPGTTSDGLDIRMVDNDNAILVAAHYVQSVTFEGATYSLLLGIEPLILKLSSAGTFQWALRTDTNWITTSVTSMDVNRTTSTLSISGWHIDDAKFGTHHLNSPFNNYDGYVATANSDSPTPVKEKPSNLLPAGFALGQNYPNPFNPTTTISYDIPTRSQVNIAVYNVLGQQVRQLVHELQIAGSYTVDWDGRDDSGNHLASGVYLYRIQAGAYSETKKMLLLK